MRLRMLRDQLRKRSRPPLQLQLRFTSSLHHRPHYSQLDRLISRGWSASNLERQKLDLPPTLSINRFLPLFTVDSLIQPPPLLDHDTVRRFPLSDRRYLPNRKLHALQPLRMYKEGNLSLNSPSRLL